MKSINKILYSLSASLLLSGCLGGGSGDSTGASEEASDLKTIPGCEAPGEGVVNNPHCQTSTTTTTTTSTTTTSTTTTTLPTFSSFEWVRQFSDANSFSSWNEAHDSVLDHDENVIVVGHTFARFNNDPVPDPDAGQGDAFVIKYDKNGNKLWSYQFGVDGPFINIALDSARAVAVDASNNIYITGYSYGALDGPLTGGHVFVRKYDPSGNLIFGRQLGAGAPSDIKVDSSGNIYIVGSTTGSFAGPRDPLYWDGFLIKLDNAGNTIWADQIGSPSQPDDLFSVEIDATGTIFVGGCLGQNGSCVGSYSKYSSSGQLLSQVPVEELVYSLALASNGDVIAAGFRISRFDSSGNLIWSQKPAFEVFAVHLDSNENVVACGRSDRSDSVLAKLDISGHLINATSFGAGPYGICSSLSISSNDDLYLSGRAGVSLDDKPFSGVSSGYVLKIHGF